MTQLGSLRCDVQISCADSPMVDRLTCCSCGCGRAYCDRCSKTYHVLARQRIKIYRSNIRPILEAK